MDKPHIGHDVDGFLGEWKEGIRRRHLRRPFAELDMAALIPAAPTLYTPTTSIANHTRLGTEVCTAAFHGTTPAPFNFAYLTPEVRIHLYKELCNTYSFLDSHALYTYKGLVLSCKQIKAKFVYEWVHILINDLNTELGTPNGLRVSGYDGTT